MMGLPPFVCHLPESSDIHAAAWQAARLKYLQVQPDLTSVSTAAVQH